MKIAPLLLASLLALLPRECPATGGGTPYRFNRAPLAANALAELPPGSIEPQGWLLEQLRRMRSGMTGRLDSLYAPVVGPRNGWLGGDGDAWERGPYWIDGLLPLAYILRDTALQARVRPWIEWTLTHQREDGYIGPLPLASDPPPEPGIQKVPREDWWPRMVMLKVLKQYFEATADARVVSCLTRYFRYQLKTLPAKPLDHWSFWANRRGGDNLMVVYWLYTITGEEFLLELATLIHRQTFPWQRVFLNEHRSPGSSVAHLYPYNTKNRYPFADSLIERLSVGQVQSFHGVNLAQGIKEPVVYFQQSRDSSGIRAVKRALREIDLYHGQPQGMFAADEPTHGTNPTQGVELCSVVEMMFSLETMLQITGDVELADRLERIAMNALPAQIADDVMSRQYFQTANQVLVSRARRNFFEEMYHAGTDLCFGLLTGYPCCTCNMHQGWPKFVQNLWYATPEGGLAAMLYGPSAVTAVVAGGVRVRITEETFFPFDESVRFIVQPDRPAEFALTFRVPSWCAGATLAVNGIPRTTDRNRLLTVKRTWRKGDTVTVRFPMRISISRWHHNAAVVERGPLVYALRLREEWSAVKNGDRYGDYHEVRTTDPWNYALLDSLLADPAHGFEVVSRTGDPLSPWSPEHSPIELKTVGRRIPEWTLYGHEAGPLPHNRPRFSSHFGRGTETLEAIRLIPYGCTTLRITEFPVLE